MIFSSAICFVLQKYKAKKQNIFLGTKSVNIFIVSINNDLLFHPFLPEDIRPDFLASISLKQKNKPEALSARGKRPSTGHVQATYDPSSSSPS